MSLKPTEFNMDLFSFQIQRKKVEIKGQPITYFNIVIMYDKSKEWYCTVPSMFCFGVGMKEFDAGSQKYSMSLVMRDKDGATPEQQEFEKFVYALVAKLKKWIIEHREELDEYDLEERDLTRRLGLPIYIKMEKNKPVEGYSPSLTCNLAQRGNTVLTEFYEDNTDRLLSYENLMTTDTKKNYFNTVESSCRFGEVYYPKAGLAKMRCTVYECVVEQKTERSNRLTGGGDRRRQLFDTAPKQPVVPVAPVQPTQFVTADDSDSSDDDDEKVPTPTKEASPPKNETTVASDSEEEQPKVAPVQRKRVPARKTKSSE